MRKIVYNNVHDVKRLYLQFLELKDENGFETLKLKKLQEKWSVERENIIKSNSLKNTGLPIKLDDLITADYKQLVLIFLNFNSIKYGKNIEQIFDYTKYSKKIASFFIHFHRELDLTTCFYCETAYINIFTGHKKIRRIFDLDHFFPKKEFPLAALSLFNLVPCCQVCNSRIKGKQSFYKFYGINSKLLFNSSSLQKLSPTSSDYFYDENVFIKVFPDEKKNFWNPTMSFSDNAESYRIEFIHSKNSFYKYITKSFLLEERYNYLNNKSEALFLLDLKRKYPYSRLISISKLLKINISELEEDIFHKNINRKCHRLFGKLYNDILN